MPAVYRVVPSLLSMPWVARYYRVDWEVDEHVRVLKRAQLRALLATSESRLLRRAWSLFQ